MKSFIKEKPWAANVGSSSLLSGGWGNGYVIIPKGHPYHGLHYDEINEHIEIHRGLTFSENASDLDDWPEISSDDLGGWVVGFDTIHAGDTLDNCPQSFVEKETERLKQQLIKAAQPKKPVKKEFEDYTDTERQDLVDKLIECDTFYLQNDVVETLKKQHPDEWFENVTNLYNYTLDLSDGEHICIEKEKEELYEKLSDMQDLIASKIDELEESGLHEKALKKLEKKADMVDSDLYIIENAESEPQEIFQWFLVSDRIACKLIEYDEPILEMCNCKWWGRGTYGQSVSLDYTMQLVAVDILGDWK